MRNSTCKHGVNWTKRTHPTEIINGTRSFKTWYM